MVVCKKAKNDLQLDFQKRIADNSIKTFEFSDILNPVKDKKNLICYVETLSSLLTYICFTLWHKHKRLADFNILNQFQPKLFTK
jgi:hypothetical protein